MATIWIKRKGEAKDLPRLLAKAMAQNLPPKMNELIMQRKFEVGLNTTDDRGGYFVVFPTSAGKHWWQFWK